MLKNTLSVIFNKICRNKFIWVSTGLGIACAVFHFWLAYPGFVNFDGYALMLSKENIQPIMMTYLFTGLFNIFGYHIWYGLLLNLLPFYLGLWLIALGFHQRYKSWWALLCYFPVLIQTIFVSLFFILTVALESSYSFLLFACLLYIILVPSPKRRFWLIALIIISGLFALFARHNGNIQIFPAIALGAYMVINEKSKWKFLLKYSALTILGFILLSGIKIATDNAVSTPDFKKPHQHVFAHQLAAMCVPENDASCFDESWFLPGTNFENIKRTFLQAPVIGDNFGWFENDCGMHTKIIVAEGIEKKWLQAVLKYPKNFLAHELRMIPILWTTPIQFVEYSPEGPKSPFYDTFNFYDGHGDIEKPEVFPKDETYMHETPLKKQLLHIWDDYLPKIPTLFWIFYMLISGIITTGLLLFRQDNHKSLAYCFHLSWGGLAAAVIYGMFYPNIFWRYIEVIWVFGIALTFGLSMYILDSIGGKEKNMNRIKSSDEGNTMRSVKLISENIMNFDLEETLKKSWKAISPCSKKSFYWMFAIINIVFLWHTVTFYFGNHDWGQIKNGVYVGWSVFDGRWAAGILQQIVGGEILPVLNNLFCFSGFCLAMIALAKYWNLPKTTFTYTIFGLFIMLLPYTYPWLQFVRSETHFWNIFIVIIGLILADYHKIRWQICAILIFTFSIGCYVAIIEAIVSIFLGKCLLDAWFNYKNFKDFIKKHYWPIIDTIIATIIFSIVYFTFRNKLNAVLSIYTTNTASLNEMIDNIINLLPILKATFFEATPFMPVLFKVLLVSAFLFVLFLLFSKKLPEAALISLITIALILSSQIIQIISQSEFCNQQRIDFFSMPYIYAAG
ncbi:MAG: glucosyltransferase domain-containing protein, partial [Alphaproteobacteria bacterium]